MTLEQLAQLVQRMRETQTAWFKFRDPRDLNRAKALEREVDAAVDRIIHPRPALFGGGE